MIAPRAREAWARTRLHVWPETCVLASLPRSEAPRGAGVAASASGFGAVIIERDEVSLVVDERTWRASGLEAEAIAGPYRVITMDVTLAPDITGYLAPAAERLASAGIPIIAQAGHRTDHILVRQEDLAQALQVLETLIRECAEPAP